MKELRIALYIFSALVIFCLGVVSLFQVSRYLFENAAMGLAFHEFGLFGLLVAVFSLLVSAAFGYIIFRKDRKVKLIFAFSYAIGMLFMLGIINVFCGTAGIVSTVVTDFVVIGLTISSNMFIRKLGSSKQDIK